jgi:hypothetical protein
MRDEMASSRFAVNREVLHESIDGEVIVIDLRTGSYYSMQGSAAEVWELVQRSPGATAAQLVEALAEYYEDHNATLAQGVVRFVEELAEEGLVDALAPSDKRASIGLPEKNGRPAAFSRPVLEKYTDMQDLVLLDPVHQVDEGGWPRLPDTTAGDSTAS